MGSPFSPPTYSGPGFTLGEGDGFIVGVEDGTNGIWFPFNPTLVAKGGAPADNPTPEEPGGTIGGTAEELPEPGRPPFLLP